MMRIAIDAMNIRAGGGVTHLQEFLGAAPLADVGAEVVVLVPWRTAALLQPRTGVTLHGPHGIARMGTTGSLLWRRFFLDEWLRRIGADVLLVPGGIYLGSFEPVVIMAQNLLPFAPRERAREGWSFNRLRLHMLEVLQARSFRRAARVVHMSEQTRELIDRRAGVEPARTAVIYHGVNPRFSKVSRTRSLDGPCTTSGVFRWLYVSIVAPYKHQVAVAEAAGILLREGLPLTIDFVGPGRECYVKQLRDAMRDADCSGTRVRYRGPANHESIEQVYAEADGFLFASSCETFGMILVEAMATGLPSAVSNRPAIPEIVGDAALLFNPESPVDIAAAMRRMMTDCSLRRELSIRARQRAAQFSWERCATETLACLANVCAAFRQRNQPTKGKP